MWRRRVAAVVFPVLVVAVGFVLFASGSFLPSAGGPSPIVPEAGAATPVPTVAATPEPPVAPVKRLRPPPSLNARATCARWLRAPKAVQRRFVEAAGWRGRLARVGHAAYADLCAADRTARPWSRRFARAAVRAVTRAKAVRRKELCRLPRGIRPRRACRRTRAAEERDEAEAGARARVRRRVIAPPYVQIEEPSPAATQAPAPAPAAPSATPDPPRSAQSEPRPTATPQPDEPEPTPEPTPEETPEPEETAEPEKTPPPDDR